MTMFNSQLIQSMLHGSLPVIPSLYDLKRGLGDMPSGGCRSSRRHHHCR